MRLNELATIRNGTTKRFSSWDVSGRNGDAWTIPAGQSRVLADIRGPGVINHIWMTQGANYRECLIKITWDDAPSPSVLCPLGDFFGLGHGIVNSYQSQLFTASANVNNVFNSGCALNCYAPMPFRKRAVVELLNESGADHVQYFYVDYELVEEGALRKPARDVTRVCGPMPNRLTGTAGRRLSTDTPRSASICFSAALAGAAPSGKPA